MTKREATFFAARTRDDRSLEVGKRDVCSLERSLRSSRTSRDRIQKTDVYWADWEATKRSYELMARHVHRVSSVSRICSTSRAMMTPK